MTPSCAVPVYNQTSDWLTTSSTYTMTSATTWLEMHLTAYIYGWMWMLDVEEIIFKHISQKFLSNLQ